MTSNIIPIKYRLLSHVYELQNNLLNDTLKREYILEDFVEAKNISSINRE